jgi:capsular exopolysaccharide synthesis family protein
VRNPESETVDSSGLEGAIATLRNHKKLILFCFALTALAAAGLSLAQQDKYSASTSLLFRDPGFSQQLFGTELPPSPDPTREAATNVKLVGLSIVADRTARKLDRGLTGEEVSDKVSVSAEGQSDVVSVTATDPNPDRARLIANTFSRQFIAFRAHTDRSKLLKAQRLAENQLDELSLAEQEGPRGKSLSEAAERLGVLASLQTGNAELVQPADLPTSPFSPKPVRNGILGAILGLLFGIGLAFLFERLNRRLREPEEAQEAVGLPVLGTIPESSSIGSYIHLPPGEQEAFRMLRSTLRYFNVDRDVKSVLVTSSGPGEGKTTVAWQLAEAAALNARVVLVEADLRHPVLSERYGLPPAPGLAELLTQQMELSDISPEGDGAFNVIVAGAIPPNPIGLIESQAMRDLLGFLSDLYDFVVIDTPPTSLVPDAFPLVSQVSGVILVCRLGQTSRDAAIGVRDQLVQLQAPLLGVVANRAKRRRSAKYGYGYGYGRYELRSPAAEDGDGRDSDGRGDPTRQQGLVLPRGAERDP